MLKKFTTHVYFQNWAYSAKLRSDALRTITPLSMAVMLGLLDYLRVILSFLGTDCNEGAPIVWAADKGFADVVGLLTKNGANVNQYNSEGYTALHCAAMNYHSKFVPLLLESGCKVESLTTIRSTDCGFTRSQHSALWYACNHGYNEIVAQFLPCIKTTEEVNKALSFAVEEIFSLAKARSTLTAGRLVTSVMIREGLQWAKSERYWMKLSVSCLESISSKASTNIYALGRCERAVRRCCHRSAVERLLSSRGRHDP